MKNLKKFNEMRRSSIHTGIELTARQINYICDDISKKYLEDFEILVDDGIFYIRMSDEFWEFDRIQDVRDFIHLIYYINNDIYDKVLRIIKRNKNLCLNFDDNLPIRFASDGYPEMVKLLLKRTEVDPSVEDNWPIRWASENGHTEVVKLLLQDPRVDPSVENNLAIKWASENGYDEIVKLLIQHPKVREKLTKKDIEEYESSY